MTDFYDRDGTPLDLFDWANKFEDWDYRHVLTTTREGDELRVTTVWIGFDQRIGWRNQGKPLIYATACFDHEINMEEYHWPTEERAMAGHDQVVKEFFERPHRHYP